jgi:hypothetical protein
MVMRKTGIPVAAEPLPKDEAAVLVFLKNSPGTQYSTEAIGRAVRPQTMKAKAATMNALSGEARVIRNWANLRLNKLYRKGLIKKGNTGRGVTMMWWA